MEDKTTYKVMVRNGTSEEIFDIMGTSFSFSTNGTLVVYQDGDSVAAFPEYVYIIEEGSVTSFL